MDKFNNFDEFINHCEKNNVVVNRDDFAKDLRDFEVMNKSREAFEKQYTEKFPNQAIADVESCQ